MPTQTDYGVDFPSLPKLMVNCHTISLKKGNLTDLPAEFSLISGLTSLNLDRNSFTKIPEVLVGLVRLKLLSFNFNNISDIRTDITRLTGGCYFCSIYCYTSRPLVFMLTIRLALETLALNYNNISSMSVLCDLTTLSSLYLSSNRLTCVPYTISKLVNLEIFTVKNNVLPGIPQSLNQLTR